MLHSSLLLSGILGITTGLGMTDIGCPITATTPQRKITMGNVVIWCVDRSSALVEQFETTGSRFLCACFTTSGFSLHQLDLRHGFFDAFSGGD